MLKYIKGLVEHLIDYLTLPEPSYQLVPVRVKENEEGESRN